MFHNIEFNERIKIYTFLFIILVSTISINYIIVPSNVLILDNLEEYTFSTNIYKNFSLKQIYYRCIERTHPVFYVLTTFPFYYFLGISQNVAILNNYVYYIILILSIYGIGNTLYNKRYGLLAAFTTSMVPIIFGLSRTYTSDFGGIALVSLSIYLLLKTDGFSTLKYSVLFGISSGISTLTYWPSTFFIFGPFLFYSIKNYREDNLNPKNIIIAISSGVLVSSIYYLPILKEFLNQLFTKKFVNCGPLPSQTAADKLLVSGHQLTSALFPIMTILFIFSSLISIIKYKERDIILFSWISVPYILTTFVIFIKNCQSYQDLFLMSVIPAMALIIALPYVKIDKNLYRKIFLVFFIFILSMQYILITFHPFLPNILQSEIFYNENISSINPFINSPENWKTNNIAKTLQNETRHVRIYYLINSKLCYEISAPNIGNVLNSEGIENTIYGPFKKSWWPTLINYKYRTFEKNVFDDIDYILLSKTNKKTIKNNEHKKRLMLFEENKNNFEMISNWEVSSEYGKIKFEIYKKNNQI